MSHKLKVILDTNILLVSISSKSKHHWLFQKLLAQEFEIVITNEILMEYEEIISQKYSVSVARNVIRTLLLLPNVTRSDIYYQWNLIQVDVDDNKFVDCAIASNVDFLVTNDKHFNVLNQIDFPKVNIVDIDQFVEELR